MKGPSASAYITYVKEEVITFIFTTICPDWASLDERVSTHFIFIYRMQLKQ